MGASNKSMYPFSPLKGGRPAVYESARPPSLIFDPIWSADVNGFQATALNNSHIGAPVDT